MGVGKTTVGKYLSENLTYDFIDVDDNKQWAKHGFSEKEHDNIYASPCIAIYRDIVIFKKSGSIIGVAKICFGCTN
mgnify:CR=1 FL=1